MPLALLSVRGDVHAHALVWGLRELGVQAEFVVLNEPAAAPIGLEAQPVKSPLSGLAAGACTVFLRRPANKAAISCEMGDWHDQANREATFNSFLSDVESTLGLHHHLINDPVRAYGAGRKLRQMTAAHKLGLNVPESIITADPDTIERFALQIGSELIFKPYRHNVWRVSDRQYATSRACDFDPTMLGEVDENSWLHGLFQRKINKVVEYRVTIFGDRLIAVAQAGSHEKVDWRSAAHCGAPLKAVELPQHLTEKLLNLCDQLGVDVCTIDIVEDSAGEYWFLDLNPYGQFLYLEEIEPSIPLLREATRFLSQAAGDAWDENQLDKITFERFMLERFEHVREECVAASGMLPTYFRKAHAFAK